MSLGKGRATNLKSHRTRVVSALGKGGVGSKLFATDGSSNPAGVTSSVARRAPGIYIRQGESHRWKRTRQEDPPPFTPGGARSSIGGYSGAMVLLYLVSAGARISLSLLCWCLSWEGENGWELAIPFPSLGLSFPILNSRGWHKMIWNHPPTFIKQGFSR